MVSARVRRHQVAFARERGISVRRACALLSVARSALRYESRLSVRDAAVLAAMRELAAQYPRYGYRRIRVFLGRRGQMMSADRAHRLWRQAGLQVPRRRPRRRVASGCPRPLPATGVGQVWAYDFVSWQNGSNESFNGKFRDECLSMQWFKNRIDAKVMIEEFRRSYNEVRPHSSLGQLTPLEFKRKVSQSRPSPEPELLPALAGRETALR